MTVNKCDESSQKENGFGKSDSFFMFKKCGREDGEDGGGGRRNRTAIHWRHDFLSSVNFVSSSTLVGTVQFMNWSRDRLRMRLTAQFSYTIFWGCCNCKNISKYYGNKKTEYKKLESCRRHPCCTVPDWNCTLLINFGVRFVCRNSLEMMLTMLELVNVLFMNEFYEGTHSHTRDDTTRSTVGCNQKLYWVQYEDPKMISHFCNFLCLLFFFYPCCSSSLTYLHHAPSIIGESTKIVTIVSLFL